MISVANILLQGFVCVYKLEIGIWDIFYRHAELLITWISLPLSLIGLVNLQIQNTNTNDAFTGVLVP